jgi:drug/metabolite transporter (DMT)-like permease
VKCSSRALWLGPLLIDPPSPRALQVGLSHSLAGALCSAIYLFPYKQAAGLGAPHVLAYGLLVVAALANTAFGLWQRRTQPLARVDRRTFWVTSAWLSLLTISGNFCGAQAVTRLDPAITSVLLRTEIVFVGGLAALLLRERLTFWLAAGASVALCGLLVMRWPLAFDSAGAGAVWALGGAASFGLMQVLTRRVIASISPVAVNTCRLWLAVGLMSLVPGMASAALGKGLEFWAYVAGAALFGPFLGRLFIMYSLRALKAAHSALLLLLAPVLAFGIGFVAFGSVPGPRDLVGGAIILLGVALPSLAALRAQRSLPQPTTPVTADEQRRA